MEESSSTTSPTNPTISKWDMVSKDDYIWNEIDMEDLEKVTRTLSHRKLHADELFGRADENNSAEMFTEVISIYNEILTTIKTILSDHGSHFSETKDAFFYQLQENSIVNLCTCYLKLRKWESILEIVATYSSNYIIDDDVNEVKLRLLSFRLIANIKLAHIEQIQTDIDILKEMLALRNNDDIQDISEYSELILEGRQRIFHHNYQRTLNDDFCLREVHQFYKIIKLPENTNESKLIEILMVYVQKVKSIEVIYRSIEIIASIHFKHNKLLEVKNLYTWGRSLITAQKKQQHQPLLGSIDLEQILHFKECLLDKKIRSLHDHPVEELIDSTLLVALQTQLEEALSLFYSSPHSLIHTITSISDLLDSIHGHPPPEILRLLCEQVVSYSQRTVTVEDVDSHTLMTDIVKEIDQSVHTIVQLSVEEIILLLDEILGIQLQYQQDSSHSDSVSLVVSTMTHSISIYTKIVDYLLTVLRHHDISDIQYTQVNESYRRYALQRARRWSLLASINTVHSQDDVCCQRYLDCLSSAMKSFSSEEKQTCIKASDISRALRSDDDCLSATQQHTIIHRAMLLQVAREFDQHQDYASSKETFYRVSELYMDACHIKSFVTKTNHLARGNVDLLEEAVDVLVSYGKVAEKLLETATGHTVVLAFDAMIGFYHAGLAAMTAKDYRTAVRTLERASTIRQQHLVPYLDQTASTSTNSKAVGDMLLACGDVSYHLGESYLCYSHIHHSDLADHDASDDNASGGDVDTGKKKIVSVVEDELQVAEKFYHRYLAATENLAALDDRYLRVDSLRAWTALSLGDVTTAEDILVSKIEGKFKQAAREHVPELEELRHQIKTMQRQQNDDFIPKVSVQKMKMPSSQPPVKSSQHRRQVDRQNRSQYHVDNLDNDDGNDSDSSDDEELAQQQLPYEEALKYQAQHPDEAPVYSNFRMEEISDEELHQTLGNDSTANSAVKMQEEDAGLQRQLYVAYALLIVVLAVIASIAVRIYHRMTYIEE